MNRSLRNRFFCCTQVSTFLCVLFVGALATTTADAKHRPVAKKATPAKSGKFVVMHSVEIEGVTQGPLIRVVLPITERMPVVAVAKPNHRCKMAGCSVRHIPTGRIKSSRIKLSGPIPGHPAYDGRYPSYYELLGWFNQQKAGIQSGRLPYAKGPPYDYKFMSVYHPLGLFRINAENCVPVAFSVDIARGMYTLTVVGQISFAGKSAKSKKSKKSKTKRRKK